MSDREIRALHLEPGDLVVVRLERDHLDREEADTVGEQVKAAIGRDDVRVVVTDMNITIGHADAATVEAIIVNGIEAARRKGVLV